MSSLSETAGPIEKLGKRRKEITLSAFVVNVRTNVGGGPPWRAALHSHPSTWKRTGGHGGPPYNFLQLERKSHRQLHLPWVAHTLT